ncbi:menaquinone biosynthesis protein [Candidatus Sumerlaeota bacterium]|nr:menaquinone biosynthesis protein [Candidatus Sumerlaeota bacterium]
MLKIGYVSYLNSLPLVYDLRALLPGAELIDGPPALLAELLEKKTIDIGLAPVIETIRHSEYTIISDAVIAADGPVDSVMLFANCPLKRINTLQLDSQSCTSNVLARLLLIERLGCEPHYVLLVNDDNEDPRPSTVQADAIVCIGDRALRLGQEKCWPHAYDLSAEWKQFTGLPFVFAAWLARPGEEELIKSAAKALSLSRDRGQQHIEAIARDAAPRIGLSEDVCRDYLAQRIQYRLTPRIREGMDEFLRRSAAAGL